ncbi:hypothetical protein [Deinococcus pimensis]|uniref:hypothetical protein n=1 Tax=Deinococcus pimensis TaxID=309888 RepID=UPI0004B228A1|nr:hypothetical protein [Deinococcus pimensis]
MFPKTTAVSLTSALLGLTLLLTGCDKKDDYAVVHEKQPQPARTAGEKTMLQIVSPAGKTELTLRQLQAMRTVRYATEHGQLRRRITYEGVLLSDLARAYGIDGRDLRVEALDNYGSVIDAADYDEYPIMLAYRGDGKLLTFKEKGPLTIVLPTHAYPNHFADHRYGSQWVWYVSRVQPK